MSKLGPVFFPGFNCRTADSWYLLQTEDVSAQSERREWAQGRVSSGPDKCTVAGEKGLIEQKVSCYLPGKYWLWQRLIFIIKESSEPALDFRVLMSRQLCLLPGVCGVAAWAWSRNSCPQWKWIMGLGACRARTGLAPVLLPHAHRSAHNGPQIRIKT